MRACLGKKILEELGLLLRTGEGCGVSNRVKLYGIYSGLNHKIRSNLEPCPKTNKPTNYFTDEPFPSSKTIRVCWLAHRDETGKPHSEGSSLGRATSGKLRNCETIQERTILRQKKNMPLWESNVKSLPRTCPFVVCSFQPTLILLSGRAYSFDYPICLVLLHPTINRRHWNP